MSSEVFPIDPRRLRLPPSRSDGADPEKLQPQIARHGDSIDGMPEIWVYRCTDDELVIYNGVTRATRTAKLMPGQTVPVRVIGRLPVRGASQPTVEERLP